MSGLTSTIYIDRIKHLRRRIVNVGALLLIFILTFILLLIKENKKLKIYEDKKKDLEAILKYPWHEFERVYDEMSLSIEDYIKSQSTPYAILCNEVYTKGHFPDSVKILKNINRRIKENGLVTIDRDSIWNAIINDIKLSAAGLIEYNNDLRSLLSLQKRKKSFELLNSFELQRIYKVAYFRWRHKKMSSIVKGLEYSFLSAENVMNTHFLDSLTPVTKNIYNQSLKLKQTNNDFIPFDILINNYFNPSFESIFNEKENQIVYQRIISFLEDSEYENLNEVIQANIIYEKKIQEIKYGEKTTIPIINFNISLNQFVLFGGIINLGILLYFYFMASNLKTLSGILKQYIDLSDNEKQALFFGLDYQISSKWLYIILNVIFFSALPVLSIFISYKILKNSNEPFLLPLIIVICLINIILSYNISTTLFRLRKN